MLRLTEIFRGESPARLLARGSLAGFAILGAGAGLTFLSEVVIARNLGVENYGLFAMVMAWLQVLVMVVLLGSNQALLRFVPVYVSSMNWSLLRGLLRQCWRGSLLLGLIVFSLVTFSLVLAGESVPSEVRLAFLIGMAALPLYALSAQRQAVLRGLHYIVSALAPENIVRPMLLMLLVMALGWWKGFPVTAASGLAINGLAVAVAFLLGLYWQQRALPGEARICEPEFRSREWLHVALPLFLIAGMQLLISRMDIILLGAITGREPAGIYTAASRIADLLVFALAAANAVVAPMIAGLYARDDMAGLQRILTLLAKGLLLFTLPLAALVMFFGSSILSLFGEGYVAGYLPLLILVCSQAVNSLCGPVGFLLAMTGHQMQSLRILALVTVLNIVLNLVLIPSFGMVGAAVATAITVVLWNLLMLRFVRGHMGIDSSVLVLFRKQS